MKKLFNQLIFWEINKPGRKSLLLNLALFISLVLAMNSFIFGLGWDKISDAGSLRKPYISPSGEVIGSVWVILIALMSIGRWTMNKYSKDRATRPRKAITILIVSCIFYPLYSIAIGGLTGLLGGLTGNIIIILNSIIVLWLVKPISKPAFYLNIPVLIWVIFATTIIISELGWI